MDSFPLSKVTSLNIAQILKKCNDVSFVRSIRTCRRLYDVANQMDRSTRIVCKAFLPFFVYFDKEQGKVMFDVPWNSQKPEGPHFNKETEEETKRFDEEHYAWIGLEPRSESRLNFKISWRKEEVYRKLTMEEIRQMLRFFYFDSVYFNPNNDLDEDEKQHFQPIFEEILEIFSYIRVKTISLQPFGEHFVPIVTSYKNYQLACEQFKYKGPRECDLLFELVEEFQMEEWYSMEILKEHITKELFGKFHKEFITRWQSGQTNLKRLRLASREALKRFDLKNLEFRASFFAKISARARGFGGDFYYYHFPSRNRWAISYSYCWKEVNCFYDISDCDGCDCQTEFCFKKLTEAIISILIDYDRAVDFGPIIDQWNAMEEKIMDKLGLLLKKFMSPRHTHESPWDCCITKSCY